MEKEFDFKNSTKELIEKVNKTSYTKLAFLAIAIGCSFSLSFFGVEKYQEKSMKTEVMLNESKAIKNQFIKDISNEEFKKFLSYLGYTANMYDTQTDLVTNALIKAEQENWVSTSNSGDAIKEINNTTISYKKTLESDITTISNLYYQIQKNTNIENISTTDLDIFNSYYSNYKANLYKRSQDMEGVLSKWLYKSDKYNRSFNDKNGINEQFREISEKNRMIKF